MKKVNRKQPAVGSTKPSAKGFLTADQFESMVMSGKDYQNHQKGSKTADGVLRAPELPPQIQHETRGMSHGQQFRLLAEYQQANRRLLRIVEAQQDELTKYPDDLPTAFVRAETELARCIEALTDDCVKPTQDIGYLRGLLRDYKAVGLLRDGTPTISPDAVFLILQDNFPNSSLRNLFNLLFADFNNSLAKVISF
jgi:hypothetical protein